MSSLPFLHRVLRKALYHRNGPDRALCRFVRGRMSLPTLRLAALFDDFDTQPVTFTKLPQGSWSAPLADVVMLLKLAACARPRRLLEIGSFRGYTALFLAQNTGDAARIVTVDHYPEHGEAYRDSPWAGKIERRVGATVAPTFAGDTPGSYDLIFVDADHEYPSVRNDTDIALPLVSPDGYVVWHDYANWGYFNGYNGVPEFLAELAEGGLPVVRIDGCDMALYSPAWRTEPGRTALQRALQESSGDGAFGDPWKVKTLRG